MMAQPARARSALRVAAALGGLSLGGCSAATEAEGGIEALREHRPAAADALAASVPASTDRPTPRSCWTRATLDRAHAVEPGAASGFRMRAVARVCVLGASTGEAPG